MDGARRSLTGFGGVAFGVWLVLDFDGVSVLSLTARLGWIRVGTDVGFLIFPEAQRLEIRFDEVVMVSSVPKGSKNSDEPMWTTRWQKCSKQKMVRLGRRTSSVCRTWDALMRMMQNVLQREVSR